MGDVLIMSTKELERKRILEGVNYGKFTLGEAAKRLTISYRQVKRIWRRYKKEKDRGLQHKNRGKNPPNTISAQVKQQILGVYQKKYIDFGPTFSAEKLLMDDHLQVNPETLRLWLKSEGLWHRRRKHKVYRERRERRPGFGDLLQIDG